MGGYPRIIAFVGYIGAGKTEAANYMAQAYGFRKTKFADGLKDMLRAIGLTEEQINGDQREVPSDLLCGVTPRYAMQTLGTEWGRNIIHRDLWVNIWRSRARYSSPCTVDDCRFPNEADVVRELGGIVVRIERLRPSNGLSPHESELRINEIKYDMLIENNHTLEEYHNSLRGIMGEKDVY